MTINNKPSVYDTLIQAIEDNAEVIDRTFADLRVKKLPNGRIIIYNATVRPNGVTVGQDPANKPEQEATNQPIGGE